MLTSKYNISKGFCQLRRSFTTLNYSQHVIRQKMKLQVFQCPFSVLRNSIDIKRSTNCSVSLRLASNQGLTAPVQYQSDFENNPTGNPKLFREVESEYHHSLIENLSGYANTIYKPDPNFKEKYKISVEEYNEIIGLGADDWSTKSAYNIAHSFISLGVYSSCNLNVSIDDERFNTLADAFISKCTSFSDDQLIDCLIALQFWPMSDHVKAPNFLKVWKVLDRVCEERYTEWSLDKNLFMMDLWFNIKLLRLSNFVYKGLNKISRKTEDLTAVQMVQTLFYISCVRKLHPAISQREYEYHIQKHITHLSIGEIGIFALAFFKTKKLILNTKLLVYMMHRVVDEIDSIPPTTLISIAKALRLSHKPEIGFTSNDLVNKLVERRMDSLNLVTSIHILHISTQVQFYNEEAITKLSEKFCSDPSSARLKDMERIAFILSLFNFIPPSTPDILEIIMKQLDEPKHVEAGEGHRLILLSLVYFLSLLRAYPEKQIRDLLSEESLNKHYDNKFCIPMQVVQTDYNRVLEGPPGTEHLLSPTMREYQARRHSLFLPDEKHTKNQFDKMMLEVIEVTNQVLGGAEYSLVTYTLPHFSRADIIFHLDEAGKPLAIPLEMKEKPHFVDVVRAPDLKGWFCVVVGGRNMYMHNVPRLVGEQMTKLRQLRILGYTPIVIPSHYWRGERNKADYLKLKYFSSHR